MEPISHIANKVELQGLKIKRFKQKEITFMYISRMLSNITQYISEAVMRIFAPSDDAYPVSGVQPFSGEIYRGRTADSW
ncbi:MAG: hypothetical protein AAGG00_20520 [Cyanobacteria bacterium P01_H01_bin.150]